jgi:hypothetical protein
MKKYLSILVFFTASILWAQNGVRREIHGKVTSDAVRLDEIYIINRNTGKSAETDKSGHFKIAAADDDTLMFISTRFNSRKIQVTEENFGELMLVALEPIVQLSEVVVERYDNINAVDLGIIPAGQKKYTPAERRLKTAGDLKPIDFLGLLGGNMPVDPIINAISGRTARLKKEVDIEKKEMLIKSVEELFDDKYYTDNLKIPANHIKGFQYFVIDDNRFTTALNSDNKISAAFIMAELAEKYKDRICE